MRCNVNLKTTNKWQITIVVNRGSEKPLADPQHCVE